MRCLAALLLALLLGGIAAGCGVEGGVEEGATVSVYVGAELCAGAREELSRAGGRAGDLRVRAVCLDAVRDGARLDLAAVGANARRASEDSTAVAYLEFPDRAAGRFAHPILDSADIGWTTSSSGRASMARVLEAIEVADSGSLRDEVREALEAS